MPVRLSQRIRRTFKTLAQLPKRQSLHYLQYRLALDSGWLKLRSTTPGSYAPESLQFAGALFSLPDRARLKEILGSSGLAVLQQQADEVVAGQACLFGGPPVPLQLEPPPPLAHWTELERSQEKQLPPEDLKLIWEPARFAWACTLARAYHLLQDEQYTRAFWNLTFRFLQANPAHQGWNWTSAQEVALRLIALAYSWQVFQHSPETTADDRRRLQAALAAHADRLPLSLAYARAQNNNHLLSEAAGMYTAGCLLPQHPRAARWRQVGWRIFQRGLQAQIDPQGVYIQHSANYTRLMLQLALWVRLLADGQKQSFPPLSQERLAQSVRWLFSLLDSTSGSVPNLGPNDGAYILPLTVRPFTDYRPVLQAAGQAFLQHSLLPTDQGDELALWLVRMPPGETLPRTAQTITRHTLRHPRLDTWAYLRAARFSSRPGHADQLHLDLWWQGHNLARDPGTYRYSAAPPWDNALVHSAVHNTVTVDGLDQMTPAGRFLFLDWAQAQIDAYRPLIAQSPGIISAHHNGYQRIGWEHHRRLELLPQGVWQVTDRLLPLADQPPEPGSARLHWLLPDWPWQIAPLSDEARLTLQAPQGEVRLQVSALPTVGVDTRVQPPLQVALFRAGECLYGEQTAQPTWGWYSPTYNLREPALALVCSLTGRPPLTFQTRFLLPDTPPIK